MKQIIIPALLIGTAVLLASCATKNHAQSAEGANDYGSAAAVEQQPADNWPMRFQDGTTAYTVFEPACDSWDGHQLAARSAVSVQPAGQSQPSYGVVAFNAITLVDKSTHTVTLANFRATSADFPSARAQTQNYLAAVVQNFPHAPAILLDRLEASMTVPQPPKADQLNNEPPKIIVATRPSVLVYIDSPPAWRPVAGTALQRVINTRMLLVKDSAGKYYFHLFDGYLEAPSLHGPWKVATTPPAGAVQAEATATGQVDLMKGAPDSVTQKVPSLSTSPVPDVYVATQPAELIEFHGAPEYAAIPGTDLLYADNTSGNVFKSLTDQQNYILVSGRWYRAASLDGPWQFVPGNQLPHDFANIPDSSPKENVKASVPGTPQAAEALIANSIPESMAVARTNQLAAPQVDGTMQLAPIEGTPLHYVANSSTPIIEVDPHSWYACQDGVWYTSTTPSGPWTVATFVPPVIYTIPTSSPLHYVTYVQVYGANPNLVYEGYTPGYMGTELADDGTVVYGTGYDYEPWIGTVWYGPPITWGWGFDDCWTPWWGWGFGCGFGWGWGFGWAGCFPPYPWWGGFHDWHDHGWWHGDHGDWHGGHGDWANTGADVHHQQGRFAPARAGEFARHGDVNGLGHAYNSRTGWLQGGQHASEQNVRGAAWSRPGNFAQNRAGGFNSYFGNVPHNSFGGGPYNYNYSFVAPRFGDMNRGYQTYPRGSWYGGNRGFDGGVPHGGGGGFSHDEGGGGFHGGGGFGGGGFHGGGGGFGGGHGGGGGGGHR